MPLYDYQCDQCGHRFEVRQGIKDDPFTTCPQCGGKIRRVIHPVGIVFKGSGFYVTDSRSQSSTTVPGRDGADKATETAGGAQGGQSDGAAATSSSATASDAKAASGSTSAEGKSSS